MRSPAMVDPGQAPIIGWDVGGVNLKAARRVGGSDVIPVTRGQVAALGRTAPERLAIGELVYTGPQRTPWRPWSRCS